jgi:hypothetical protein
MIITVSRLSTLDAISRTVAEALLTKGGVSVNLDGEEPSEGYMVSLPTSELRVSGVPTLYLIKAWLMDIAVPRMQDGDFIGAWFDAETGHSYLDVSRNIPDLVGATEQGRQWRQKALFDIVNARSIGLN